MKRRIVFYLVWVCLLIAWPGLPSARALAAGPPDVIGEYAIAVTPQPDGTLLMHYTFTNYCASTDFPADVKYLEVGVPNTHFTIVDFGPKDWVTGAEARMAGGSLVHLSFARLPKQGDCFNASFTIRQEVMAYVQGDNVSFQFTPGWFDFATIKQLTITWALPGNAALVRSLTPLPATRDDNQAVWQVKNLAPNEKYYVNLLLSKAAYPNLPQFSPSPSDVNSATNSSSSTSEATGSSDPGVIVLIVLIIGAIFVYQYLMGDAGGGTYGAFTSRGGSSSTRSSSCVRSSCANSCVCARSCACACAGGGRVGCSRKAIGYPAPWLGRRPALANVTPRQGAATDTPE